jgi:succinate dehydrogenase / fumarate reductase membrane anchor subunit
MVNRVVVGAHYGLGSWLVQRMTAAIMAIYTLILLVVFAVQPPSSFTAWKTLFSQGWMRAATLAFIGALLLHAWVGMRDVYMDYVKPIGLRLAVEVLTIILLVVYAAWAAQIFLLK